MSGEKVFFLCFASKNNVQEFYFLTYLRQLTFWFLTLIASLRIQTCSPEWKACIVCSYRSLRFHYVSHRFAKQSGAFTCFARIVRIAFTM